MTATGETMATTSGTSNQRRLARRLWVSFWRDPVAERDLFWHPYKLKLITRKVGKPMPGSPWVYLGAYRRDWGWQGIYRLAGKLLSERDII